MIVWVQNYDFSFKITKETRFYCFSLLKKDTNSCNILQILAQYLQKCYFGGNTLNLIPCPIFGLRSVTKETLATSKNLSLPRGLT